MGGQVRGWKKRAEGVVKVNCDVAWDVHLRKAGLGVVARTHSGSIQARRWKVVHAGCLHG